MRLLILSVAVFSLSFAGCSGGAAGSPNDDIGDIFVLTTSPGNGDELDMEDANDTFNPLNNPTLTNPGAVTIVFTNTLDPTSVLNPDPADPQGTRNVRLFYFDTSQGPFDPQQPTVPGVNPPGANVLVPATTVLTTSLQSRDTLIIRPTGITTSNPLPEGQYSGIIETGVRGADGDGMKGKEYFFYFRIGQDRLGPVVVSSSPAPGQRNVDPTTDLTITMSETILSSTVNGSTLQVTFQPAGSVIPSPIPGFFYTDGGNGPGNNFPDAQLDHNGIPGFSGTSPRNGVDIVFRPDLSAFPVNMTAEDPNDPVCTNRTDPPRKGNAGFPLGQAITVNFVTAGIGVTDTAGNPIPAGSPNTSFTFETKPLPKPVFAPNTNGAVYYGDTVGVGVIDVDPARTPYLVGPNPARAPNSVVTAGTGAGANVIRIPIPDLIDVTTDTRGYTSFYTFVCDPAAFPTIFMGNVYAASGTTGGGQVIVIDAFRMEPLGRFGSPSPGGLALTANGAQSGRLTVSNFSANTVTVYDIGDVRWFTGANLWATQPGLNNDVLAGGSRLILNETDFRNVFPAQRIGLASPPGPPVIGTINVGISPTKVKITGLPASLGAPGFPCFSPVLVNNTIVCVLNAGENTVDFSELTNLNQSLAINPDLDGVNISSQGTDVAWSPLSFGTGSYYFYIASIGGTVELFATGFLANSPSVRPESSSNLSPNKIINSIGGLIQPSAVQWITNGNAVSNNNNYSHSVLIAETGENRLQQLSVTAEFPTILFSVINSSHAAGLGPVDITGDPAGVGILTPCGPRFTDYYVANAGEGNVRRANYGGGVIGTTIPVPGVQLVASWWSR